MRLFLGTLLAASNTAADQHSKLLAATQLASVTVALVKAGHHDGIGFTGAAMCLMRPALRADFGMHALNSTM